MHGLFGNGAGTQFFHLLVQHINGRLGLDDEITDDYFEEIIFDEEIDDISYYSDYKTAIDNTNGEKLELIIMKLPLNSDMWVSLHLNL